MKKTKTPVIIFISFTFIIMFLPTENKAQNIIPRPVHYEEKRGNFKFKNEIVVYYDNDDEQSHVNALFLKNLLENINDITIALQVRENNPATAKKGIILQTQPTWDNEEKYTLSVQSDLIEITGGSQKGVFYAIQTLRQMLPVALEQNQTSIDKVKINQCHIEDYPRFGYRGLHLDVSRHFFNVEEVKRYIDLMVLHKMNTFHWHLTDDQGWRIEIKQYPKLTEIGSKREHTLIGHGGKTPFQYDGKPHEGFYTQEEIREVIDYAEKRQIRIIPEIEMPGHALAALASYPEMGCTGGPYKVASRWGIFEDAFCAGNDKTFVFLENILTEVAALFPGEYIHIGGDECLKNRWEECDKCQQRIKQEGLKNEHELQSYFIQRIGNHLEKLDKKLIGWDEILEGGLAQGATVMSWRGYEGGIQAAKSGHDAIMTPTSFCYFDYYQDKPETQPLAIGGYLTLRRVYEFEPVPRQLNPTEAKHILGGQANLWTEYIKTLEHLEYMAYPRAVALSEILWTPGEMKDYDDFTERLKAHFKRLDKLEVNYYNPFEGK